MGNLDIQHLTRTGSDHAPLLFTCKGIIQNSIRPFRFIKFWTSRDDFKEVLKDNWNVEYPSNIMVQWKLRQKKTKQALTKWSRDMFRDTFKQLKIREEIMKMKEDLFELNPSTANRSVLQLAQARV
uniref:Putative ovule protein n=1 Tax=Solanum chacoense TaxID=4108 RepID=A0A0V0HWU9_SOLCH